MLTIFIITLNILAVISHLIMNFKYFKCKKIVLFHRQWCYWLNVIIYFFTIIYNEIYVIEIQTIYTMFTIIMALHLLCGEKSSQIIIKYKDKLIYADQNFTLYKIINMKILGQKEGLKLDIKDETGIIEQLVLKSKKISKSSYEKEIKDFIEHLNVNK